MGKFASIAVTGSLPGANSVLAGALPVENVNSLSISGRVTAGAGQLYLLRKMQLAAGGFQFRLWRSDRPIQVDAAVRSGWFDAIFVLPEDCGPEEFALYNPAGVTFEAGSPVAIGETLAH